MLAGQAPSLRVRVRPPGGHVTATRAVAATRLPASWPNAPESAICVVNDAPDFQEIAHMRANAYFQVTRPARAFTVIGHGM
jgi:hypothetical protein